MSIQQSNHIFSPCIRDNKQLLYSLCISLKYLDHRLQLIENYDLYDNYKYGEALLHLENKPTTLSLSELKNVINELAQGLFFDKVSQQYQKTCDCKEYKYSSGFHIKERKIAEESKRKIEEMFKNLVDQGQTLELKIKKIKFKKYTVNIKWTHKANTPSCKSKPKEVLKIEQVAISKILNQFDQLTSEYKVNSQEWEKLGKLLFFSNFVLDTSRD